VAASGVYVKGLNELIRDLRRAGAEVYRDLQAELRRLAQEVADEAKSLAPRETGQLADKIRPSVRGGVARVRATALSPTSAHPSSQPGYPYPARFEFGDFNRPFLGPALDRKRGQIESGLEQMVDRLLSRTNLG
jgi:hypothetical protein